MEEKRLMRSATDRKIAGVCGGFAKYFNLSDTTPLRLVCALLIILGGLSIWVYVICWLVMPEEPHYIQNGPVDNQ